MRRFIHSFLTLLPLLLASSCYYLQEDVFDKSTALRVQERMEEARRVLQSQKQGWVLEMYPAADRHYGGVVFTLVFQEDSVAVRSENSSPETEEVTLYNIRANNGPTLTFDTYNSLLHHYATPSSSLYEARGGEFEFLICDVKEDCIELQGTRTGNRMSLHALTQPAQSYLEGVQAMRTFLSRWEPTVGDDDFQITIKPRLNRAVLTDYRGGGKTSVEMPFAVTPEGVRFYEEVSYKEERFETLAATADGDYFGEGITGNGTHLRWIRPKGRHTFEDYHLDGEWTLNAYVYRLKGVYTPFSVNVTLTTDPDHETVKVSGLWEHPYDLILKYNIATGYLEINPQRIEPSNLEDFWYWVVLGYTNSPTATYVYTTATFGKYLDDGIQLVEQDDGSFVFEFNSRFVDDYDAAFYYPSVGIAYRSEDGTLAPGGKKPPEPKWLISGYEGAGDMTFDCRFFMMESLVKR